MAVASSIVYIGVLILHVIIMGYWTLVSEQYTKKCGFSHYMHSIACLGEGAENFKGFRSNNIITILRFEIFDNRGFFHGLKKKINIIKQFSIKK